jgi:predicted transcriptional regulator
MKSQSSAMITSPVIAATEVFYHPAIGQVFEPHRLHLDNEARRRCGFDPIYLPAIVGAQRRIGSRKITDGPKRVYEYLVRRAGQNGDCWPSYERIASDLGKSPRQVQNDVRALEDMGLITHENRAARKSNTYHFIWHPIFERQGTATQMTGKIRSISRFEWQNPTDLSGSVLPTNLYKESSQKKAAAAEHANDSTDSGPSVPEKVVASSSDEFPKENTGGVPGTRAVGEVSAALSRNGVAIRTPAEVQTLIDFARKNGVEPAELARFIEYKCREKSERGDPIRCAEFFFVCIPCDVVKFRTFTRKHVEHSPPRFWKDPFEGFAQKGEFQNG